MTYADALAEVQQEARALGERLHGISLDSSPRARVALGCFAIAQQHHSGIVVLLSRPLPLQASAYALMRPLVEAMFRGFWVARCATDEKVENILMGTKKQIDTATIVRELVDAAGLGGRHADFYKDVWPRLSVYTHTYEEAIAPWLHGDDVEQHFTEDALLSLLKRVRLSAHLIEAGIFSLQVHARDAA